jgi:hypothetical protein
MKGSALELDFESKPDLKFLTFFALHLSIWSLQTIPGQGYILERFQGNVRHSKELPDFFAVCNK